MAQRVVVRPGFEVYHQGRYIASDIYHSGEKEHFNFYTCRVYYMCVRIRTCAPPGGCAPSSSFRYPLREIIRERRSERSSKRPDGRCIILVSYLTSIAGLPQVAITTSAIFLPGELSAIKRSVDLLRTSPRAQRDVLIVRLDRYDSSLCAGLASINPLVGIN